MTKLVYCGTIQDQILTLDVDYNSMSLEELIEFNRLNEIATISAKKLSKYKKEDYIFRFKQKLEMLRQALRQGY